MFYTYAEKQRSGLFTSWQTRQVAFDTLRRYLYYSEPVSNEFPIVHHSAQVGVTGATTSDEGSRGAGVGQPADGDLLGAANIYAGGSVSEVSLPPSRVTWRKKVKITAVLPLGTTPTFNPRSCASERDLYQLEIQGESRPMACGETPPAGPLLCPGADLSVFERARCNVNNDAYIRDPFFLKELFDSLRDQFEELERQRAHAAVVESDGNSAGSTSNVAVGAGTKTLLSPRGPDGAPLHGGAVVPVRVIFRSRDEREFRRFWYVLQWVLGYDKLIVRPYRGLPPYDPRNGVAFAHIPMAVWQTFHSLDKAVFYTFIRGNVYALEGACGGGALDDGATVSTSSRSGRFAGTPRLRCTLEGAYLCITSDSVLCMRPNGKIPRWLRLAEVEEFHWSLVARDPTTNTPSPFCVFLSDAPIPDLFFKPTPPAHDRDAIATYSPLVDVRRITSVIHDSCYSSLSTRRVIRMREVQDGSMESYVARVVQVGQRRPVLQCGTGYNSTLSCPLPKEQLAAVWQQVQAELLERGNMTNRAAIPIYASNARDLELSEDQLSTVERELDEIREQRDDIVGMPLERAKQLERRHREAVAVAARANASRHRHRDTPHGTQSRPPSAAAVQSSAHEEVSGATPSMRTMVARMLHLTTGLLQTPQIQEGLAVGAPSGQGVLATRRGEDTVASPESSSGSSRSDSMAATSEYSSYSVPGARYISQDEWQREEYATAASAPHINPPADAPHSPTVVVAAEGNSARSDNSAAAQVMQPHDGEHTLNEIIGRSMAALNLDRVNLHQVKP